MISQAVTQLLDTIASRQRDLQDAYAAGAVPAHGDAEKASHAAFVLDPLSVAAPPEAYFATRDRSGQLLFTRDGSFAMRDGTLVDSQDRPILGYRANSSMLQPLEADPIDVAFGAPAHAQIDGDGFVSYDRATIEPRSGRTEVQQVTLGRLALAWFPAGTRLQRTDAEHFTAPEKISPKIGTPRDGTFGPVSPFVREGSRVDIDAGLDRLQEAYVALDALRAANAARGSIQKSAMDLLK